MGVTYSLRLVDPAKFSRVVEELKPHPFGSAEDAAAYLRQNHVAVDSYILQDFEEAIACGDDEFVRAAYSSVLTSVLSEREWCLDKALHTRALHMPIQTIPDLAAIRFLVDFSGWDVQVPFQLSSESGLYGLWSIETLTPALTVLDRFGTRENASACFKSEATNIWNRLMRRRKPNPSIALQTWLNYWDFWLEIRSAVKTTVDKGWLLGYAMYP